MTITINPRGKFYSDSEEKQYVMLLKNSSHLEQLKEKLCSKGKIQLFNIISKGQMSILNKIEKKKSQLTFMT